MNMNMNTGSTEKKKYYEDNINTIKGVGQFLKGTAVFNLGVFQDAAR